MQADYQAFDARQIPRDGERRAAAQNYARLAGSFATPNMSARPLANSNPASR